MNTCRGIGALWACASDGASGETVCVHAREVNSQNEAAMTLVKACMKGSFRGSEYPTQAKKAFPPEKADRPNRFLIGWAVVSFVLRSYEAR
jgi:hypothetical protein